nr:alpha-galactosidase [Clostridia bacterium]
MIKYLKREKVFVLNGKSFTYALFVNKADFLQNIYFDKKISKNKLIEIANAADAALPCAEDKNFDMGFDKMPTEYAFYGRGDYNEPTAVFERQDGALFSRFRYKGHKIKKVLPQLGVMPCVRGAGDTLTITLKDDFSDVEINLNYTVFAKYDIIVRNAEIVNRGENTVKIRKAFSFCLQTRENDLELIRFYGRWAKERMPEITPIGHGITRIQSIRGTSSHQLNPFVILKQKRCKERTGKCLGFQLVYSGSFAFCAELSGNDTLRVQGGISDSFFSWNLETGERFITPQVLIGYSDKGLGGLSSGYHDFIRNRIINPDFAYKTRPIVINNWEATYFNFDDKKICTIIDAAADLGIDTFVLDDGWFGKRDTDTTGLGDWFVNENKLKGGLDGVIRHCRDKGMSFGLWFEPEMVSEDSDFYRRHPDYIVGKRGVKPAMGRTQFVLDFTRKEVVDSVFDAVSAILSRYDISYVKWDMNRSLSEYFSESLAPDRQGEFFHRYTLGVYDLAKRLTSRFNDILFEGCASGGGRFDAGMLYYFPQIWTSDNTDAADRAKIQWGTSFGYPISAMSCHVSTCPNHQTGRTTPFETRGNVASLGPTGYELDLTLLTEEEKNLVKKQISDYKRTAGLVLTGDFYRLCDPCKGDAFCVCIVSKDRCKAYLVYTAFTDMKKEVKIKIPCLDKKGTYLIDLSDERVSGKELTSIGITVSALKKYQSIALNIIKLQE